MSFHFAALVRAGWRLAGNAGFKDYPFCICLLAVVWQEKQMISVVSDSCQKVCEEIIISVVYQFYTQQQTQIDNANIEGNILILNFMGENGFL